MKIKVNKLIVMSSVLLLLNACGGSSSSDTTSDSNTTFSTSQGKGTTTTTNLYSAGQRVAALGTITSTDSKTWAMPAQVNYEESTFPFASDLYNPDGNKYSDATTALAALDGSDIVTIDSDGEIITAFVFADNYFEMYINGTQVGKDTIPFTSFNSNIVRFKVKKPFTIAMLLVDWEENLGLGSEAQALAYHPGDGGMVAVFKDSDENIISVTDSTWKAQTYYTSPIQDLTCFSESGSTRNSSSCTTADSDDGTSYYGLHWERPSDWTSESYDDSDWPSASTYTNDTIGVDNKESYTNFTDIFDNSSNDAQFIWSSNVILDNEVLVRKVVAE